jgi:hypothetical protein
MVEQTLKYVWGIALIASDLPLVVGNGLLLFIFEFLFNIISFSV